MSDEFYNALHVLYQSFSIRNGAMLGNNHICTTGVTNETQEVLISRQCSLFGTPSVVDRFALHSHIPVVSSFPYMNYARKEKMMTQNLK